MPIAVKLLDDQIKKVSETNTLLDMLLEFDRTLDNMDLYAFKNWLKGEVLEGPDVDRHYVTVKLLYPYQDMPDPAGAERLFDRGALVKYTKNQLISPVKVKSFQDVTTEMTDTGKVKYKAKTKTEDIWIVEIKLPRRFVDEFSLDAIETEENEYIDADSLTAENQMDSEQQLTGNNAEEQGI
jgi:hypothetical protein